MPRGKRLEEDESRHPLMSRDGSKVVLEEGGEGEKGFNVEGAVAALVAFVGGGAGGGVGPLAEGAADNV